MQLRILAREIQQKKKKSRNMKSSVVNRAV